MINDWYEAALVHIFNSCCLPSQDTGIFVFTTFDQFKPQVWQKQVFARRNPTLFVVCHDKQNVSCSTNSRRNKPPLPSVHISDRQTNRWTGRRTWQLHKDPALWRRVNYPHLSQCYTAVSIEKRISISRHHKGLLHWQKCPHIAVHASK